MQFLHDNGCTIGFRSGVLQCGQRCWDLARPDKEWSLPVRFVNKVKIPSGHETVTSVAVDKITDSPVDCTSNQEWFPIPQAAMLEEANIACPTEIVTLRNRSGSNSTCMCLTNYSDTEVLLNSSTEIALVDMMIHLRMKQSVELEFC